MTSEISEELRRQRKALMLTTSLLVLMKFLEPNLVKITMLGAQFEFPHIDRLYLAFWIFWSYNVIRYYQYYRQDGRSAINAAWGHSWSTFYSSKIKRLAIPKIENEPGFMAEESKWKASLKCQPESVRSKRVIYYEYNSGIIDKNTQEHIKVTLPKYKFLKEKIKAIAHFLRNRPHFLDIYFPFAFVLFALWYCNHECWDGNLLKNLNLISCE